MVLLPFAPGKTSEPVPCISVDAAETQLEAPADPTDLDREMRALEEQENPGKVRVFKKNGSLPNL